MDTDKTQDDPATVKFKLQYGKTCTDLSLSLSSTIGDLKQEAHERLGIPPAMQKLLIKGQMKADSTTLQEAGIKKGLRVMLIGSRSAALLSKLIVSLACCVALTNNGWCNTGRRTYF